MTHREKDAEITRLRAENKRLLDLLAQAMNDQVALMQRIPLTPLIMPQVPLVVRKELSPAFVCPDCQRSTSGRCGMHAVTFIPITSSTIATH